MIKCRMKWVIAILFIIWSATLIYLVYFSFSESASFSIHDISGRKKAVFSFKILIFLSVFHIYLISNLVFLI